MILGHLTYVKRFQILSKDFRSNFLCWGLSQIAIDRKYLRHGSHRAQTLECRCNRIGNARTYAFNVLIYTRTRAAVTVSDLPTSTKQRNHCGFVFCSSPIQSHSFQRQLVDNHLLIESATNLRFFEIAYTRLNTYLT